MNLTTIAVDLAKDVFQVGVADHRSKIVERHRLTRSQFERFIGQRERSLWVMEACGGAHYWARTLIGLGHEAKLLPPAYVRPYVRGNKTDRGRLRGDPGGRTQPRDPAGTGEIDRRIGKSIRDRPRNLS